MAGNIQRKSVSRGEIYADIHISPLDSVRIVSFAERKRRLSVSRWFWYMISLSSCGRVSIAPALPSEFNDTVFEDLGKRRFIDMGARLLT